ncbi:CotH kinase family protein [Portibacter lacus]|uniref:Spore coat protein n=1 Tax=Portibacter lacus TaxID=1099794 RepID=A0AA37SJY9_9BACT|nr:CotH kinase family protein [Portibacter lacus]GLR15415.1 hypothetical protein GCM10007940_00300 [Portibacter lacus]
MINGKYLFLSMVISFICSSCYDETTFTAGEGLDDWSETTHSANADPDYDVVFPDNKVNKFTITIANDEWESMQDNLTDIYGFSTRPGGDFSDETPEYFPCELEFNGIKWYNVGIRYKGNSSLQASAQGEQKLPFRLDFDEFEDDYPEITNQTFYGFPALSMSSNYNDKSLMREHTANYLFAESGIPAPSAAYYELYVDYGQGPVYFGLYTAVEVVFETMLKKSFGSDYGNCYKPEDDGAQFSTYGFNLSDFENKTTGGTGEEDIEELYNILHSAERTSDVEAWKDKLESVFDVDGFLKWLAVNTTIQNWDTYGRMAHNYYLYHDPADGLIKWIPWDNNEAFDEGKQGGALAFNFSGLNGTSWPLIGYLMNVSEYEEIYKGHIVDFIEGPFEQSNMENYYSITELLIKKSMQGETTDYSYLNSYNEFESAVNVLKSHNANRIAAANAYAK